MIRLARVYESSAPAEGARFLVERLWPRGVKKDALQLDGWLKDVAPSPDLRKWFDHDPAKWDDFRERYYAELDQSGAWETIVDATRHGPVTLLYSSRDSAHNCAVALKAYVEAKLASSDR